MSNKECLENNTESSGGNTKKTLYEKIASLMEKAQELSTLCDVQPGIVIYTPGEDILWPTASQAKERFQNYLSFRWDTRNDNLVTHETNLEKKKKAQEENIRIMEQENEEKEMELLFNEVIDGKSYLELDARELKGMIKLIALKKTKVDERKKQLQEEDQPIKGLGGCLVINGLSEKKKEWRCAAGFVVVMENKFDALEEEEEKKETTDKKGHQGEEKDKMIDENKVDKKRDINQSASSSSGQKDRQTESQSSIAGRGGNSIEISSEENETVVEDTPNSTRSTNQKGNDISKEKATRKNKEEDMQDKDESLKKAPDLMEEREDQIQERRELEKDENMEYNIQQISKAGDLSPRHMDSLKNEEIEDPLIIGGDFNVIINEEEKLGGLAFMQGEAIDFAICINNCALEEVKFTGSRYTWWNGRIVEDSIFKRLDRILVNQAFITIFPSSKIHHLIRQGNPFMEFQAKLKRVKKALTSWSKSTFGNIFQQIVTIEDIIKAREVQLEIDPSIENRAELNKIEAELKKYLEVDEEYWKQKEEAEVLSRGLNKLHTDPQYKGYGLPKWSPEINHLSYADDTILFGSSDKGSIIKMMKVLTDYEKVSDGASKRIRRNHDGDLMYAEAQGLGVMTNMEAELIIAGLKYCVGRGYYTCIRMEMMKTIRGEWKIPWEMIEEIKEIASQFHSATKHGKDNNTEYGQESATNNKSENKQQPQ
ncbi:hypothetical protein MTR67_003206 [Solanum verrucosum]|uniref:MADS-box domain-containing protein n=1 Tax=Solanum verrucosum TaxID=315347 RepID=A0AAF0PWF2_SOLVR|nr:hypothetical protein MTR67_003206 [Solanum verrucosum]